MAQSIDFIALRNAEYLQFLSSTIDVVEDNDPAVLNVLPQLTSLKSAYNISTDLFKLPQDSPLSKELLSIDARRNNGILGIIGVVRSYKKHFQQEHRDAAKLLHNTIKLYGKKIYRMNYHAKSAIVSSWVNNWEDNPGLATAATLLHLDDWIAELKASNEAFIANYDLRTQEHAAKSTATFKQKRKEGMAAYHDLINHLEARAITDVSVNYKKVLSEIDALLDQYKVLLHSRKGHKKKQKKDDEPLEETEHLEEETPEI